VQDLRRNAPATHRNREAIWQAIKPYLSTCKTLLEVASGSGQHAVYFAIQQRSLQIQPSDPDPVNRASIQAWIEHEKVHNVRPPLDLHTTSLPWPSEPMDAVLCINMIHISDWSHSEALFRGSAPLLSKGAYLFTYGPYLIDGQHTSESNIQFDAWLKSQNPAWGVRDIAALQEIAAPDFILVKKIRMPANNFMLIFQRE
jgi:cyclopropane fatty-acyl-phospholipid synthase-like methyltransferase